MTNETMKSESTNKTKILLLGVTVALISMLSSMDIMDTKALNLFVSEATTEQREDVLKTNNKLKLEKLAVSRKLVKDFSQKVEKDDNTMVN